MSERIQAMMPLAMVGEKVARWIAEKGFPAGSTLRCVPCGKSRPCTTSQIAEYLVSGYPRCRVCGHTTDLVTPRDEATR